MIPGLTPITGFKPFLSMWYDATEQILLETDENKLSNDIQLFSILREVMLAPEKPTFIRSYKLNDFTRANIQTNFQQRSNRNFARITYTNANRPYNYTHIPRKYKIAPNTPAPISYIGLRDTKMFEMSNQTSIHDNCIFQYAGIWDKPPHKIYTVTKNNFLTEIDEDTILHTVSERIMTMVATNTRNNINLDTFKNLTQKMLEDLQTKTK